jgi:hypothetical protein
MICTDGIVANVLSDCTTSRGGGLEVEAYIFNRLDITLTYNGTYPNKITGIAKVGGALGYKLKGVKRLLNSGYDIVQADDRPDKWAHYFSFQQFEIAAAKIVNVDAMDDVVIVVNRKDKTATGEGTFVVLGAKNGLWKSSDTIRENDSNGARKLEYKSMAGQEEAYSEYTMSISNTYAATLAALEGMIV